MKMKATWSRVEKVDCVFCHQQKVPGLAVTLYTSQVEENLTMDICFDCVEEMGSYVADYRGRIGGTK